MRKLSGADFGAMVAMALIFAGIGLVLWSGQQRRLEPSVLIEDTMGRVWTILANEALVLSA